MSSRDVELEGGINWVRLSEMREIRNGVDLSSGLDRERGLNETLCACFYSKTMRKADIVGQRCDCMSMEADSTMLLHRHVLHVNYLAC